MAGAVGLGRTENGVTVNWRLTPSRLGENALARIRAFQSD